MRDLTEQENKKLNSGVCSFCGSPDFYEGPSGAGSVNIYCAKDTCGAKFCYHGGIFPAQLIQEPLNLPPIPKTKAKSKTEDDVDFDGDAFLDFMSPPKDKTAVAVTKRKVNRYYNLVSKTVYTYFEPLITLGSQVKKIFNKLREKRP